MGKCEGGRIVYGLAASIRTLDEILRDLAELSGEPAFLRAANALRQIPAGRPALNDTKLIEEAIWLFNQGRVKSMNQALQKVARTVADEEDVRAVAERLRRKMRADAKIHPRNGFSG